MSYKVAIHGHSEDKINTIVSQYVKDRIERRLLILEYEHKDILVLTGLHSGTEIWAAWICHELKIPFEVLLPYNKDLMQTHMEDYEMVSMDNLLSLSLSWSENSNGDYAGFKLGQKAISMIQKANHNIIVYDPGITDGGAYCCMKHLITSRSPFTHIVPRINTAPKIIDWSKL